MPKLSRKNTITNSFVTLCLAMPKLPENFLIYPTLQKISESENVALCYFLGGDHLLAKLPENLLKITRKFSNLTHPTGNI